jgi:hypothetical protein
MNLGKLTAHEGPTDLNSPLNVVWATRRPDDNIYMYSFNWKNRSSETATGNGLNQTLNHGSYILEAEPVNSM